MSQFGFLFNEHGVKIPRKNQKDGKLGALAVFPNSCHGILIPAKLCPVIFDDNFGCDEQIKEMRQPQV